MAKIEGYHLQQTGDEVQEILNTPVKTSPQTLTEGQKAQARANINAQEQIDPDHKLDYGLLSNTPNSLVCTRIDYFAPEFDPGPDNPKEGDIVVSKFGETAEAYDYSSPHTYFVPNTNEISISLRSGKTINTCSVIKRDGTSEVLTQSELPKTFAPGEISAVTCDPGNAIYVAQVLFVYFEYRHGGWMERKDVPYDAVKYSAQALTTSQKAQARSNIGAGTYSKPSEGIPASDLKPGVIPDVSQFITKSVNDLTNYYLKSQTYTKDEVAALIGAIQQFHYEIYASRQDVVSPANNVLYLIGPTGSGADKYEEYVYDSTKQEPWVKIGDTSIDLSGLVTTEALNTALAAYTTSADLATLLSAKQDTIADLADIRTGSQDNVKYTQQTLTDAQQEQARTNIGATAPEVFWAEYGTTTQAQVQAAVADGKLVACYYNGRVYVYAGESNAGYSQFTSMLYDTAFRVYLKNSSWGNATLDIPTDVVKYAAQSLSDSQKAQARTNIGAGTYSKPDGGIPASDLADGVIPDVSQFITKSVNDLANYYLKSETYTKDEVAALIGAIQQFHYEIAASTSAVTNPQSNVLYLIGPTGSGSDKYEEYVYSNGWVKIGDTSIDLSGYVTTTALNTALAAYTTSADLATLLAGKQDTISDLETIRSGAAAGATAYQKPSGGIPASDLADKYAGSPSAGGAAFKAMGIPFGEVDSTSTATEITATVDNFPDTLTDGVCAYIRNDVIASASGWTLDINGTGAKPVYQSLADASRVTTLFSAASTHLFIYNSSRVEGGCWDLFYGYNSNDNTLAYNVRYNSASKTAIDKFARYRILFSSADDAHWVPANTSTSTNATASRTVNQTPINPFGQIVYYGSTTTVSEDGTPGATVLYTQYNITLGYSFNRTGAALTLTTKTPVYIKCAPQSNGSAIIDADTPYVQALPSTEDGKIYIYLGVASSATAVEMSIVHPVYYYKDGLVRPWTNTAVVSITVDQTYDGTSTNAQSGVAVAGALTGKQDTIDASHKLDYSLLSNTPTIPAAQVNSDWNASSGVAQILNKPTIPPNKTLVLTDFPEDGIGCYWLDPDWTYCSWDELSDAFNGKYEAVYIHIAAYYDEDTQEYRKERYITTPIRLSSDYYEVGSSYIEFDIRGEVIPDIFTCCIELGPTSYIQVSYRRAVPPLSTNIEQDKTHNDMTATPNAVYNAIHPAVQTTQPQGGFLPNVEYNLGTLTGSVTFALASAVSGIPNKWYWCFTAGATAPTITWPSGLLWPQPDAEPPTIEAGDEVEVEVKNGHIVALVFKPTS